ncbi:SIR2 family protein [Zymobacter sp. IVIA_5232.4 C2]|uniref:SIR2 family protein n=1 Tax=Zymobacter sp. IVIA_5232.4 C2 TaxID=3394855 RepID=UPI0039C1A64F
MQYFNHDDDKVISMLATFFGENTLIPIIGAGFTQGEKTGLNSTVPSGDVFREIMCDAIVENKKYGEREREKIINKSFSDLSQMFFDDAWVDINIRKKILEERFENVTINEIKRSFLRDVAWPYIYTLNVDDAIEKCSDYIPVLPYDSSLSQDSRYKKTLYKIHGDISYELRHNVSRLVFKKSDYLASIDTNRTMLNFLSLDFKEKNIIYIGCSLDDEVDISFVSAKQDLVNYNITNRIFFLDEKPDEIDEQDYIAKGINTIILYDKKEYGQIYSLIKKAYAKSEIDAPELEPFCFDCTKLGDSYDDNKDYLVSGVSKINNREDFDNKIIPYFYGNRDIESDVLDSIKEFNVIFLIGPRISGKTLLSYSLLSRLKDRRKYAVGSSQRISESSFRKLLCQENSVILLDSHSVENNIINLIKREKNSFNEKNLKLIICIDSNSEEFRLWGMDDDKDVCAYRVKNNISLPEVEKINEKSIKVHLPTFNEGKYLIEKIFNVFEIIGEVNLIKNIPLDEKLYFLLCILATKHSVTGQEIVFAGYDLDEIKAIAKENTPFLDMQKISKAERVDHTTFKIVTYASSWVVAVLNEFYINKGKAWCVDTLIKFLGRLYNKDKRLATQIRMFDNLNYMFRKGRGNSNGVGGLIIDVYDKLQSIEGRNPQFYVQKSKAYYNSYDEEDVVDKMEDRIRELDIAFSWATSNKDETAKRDIIHNKALLWIKKMNKINVKDISEKDFHCSLLSILEALNNDDNISYSRTLSDKKSRSAKSLRYYVDKVSSSQEKSSMMLKYRDEWNCLKMKIE